MTSNIRFEHEGDGQNNWPNRRNLWKKIIEEKEIELLGTQEGRRPQLNNANEILSHLEIVDSHRDWIPERMYPCIFINNNKINVIKSGDFWLSETPGVAGSKSFNSSFPRLCTWALIKKDSFYFYVFNCHLDHMLPETRNAQSKVLTEQMKKINENNYPIILMGDFNESPSESVRKNINQKFELTDTFENSGIQEQGTHHKFSGNNKETSRIDWILISNHFECQEFEICKNKEGDHYPSDHFPIFAKLAIK